MRRHEVVESLDNRIANLTGLSAANSESYQVLRYTPPNQFYRRHHDFIEAQMKIEAGPRLFTVLLYLQGVGNGMGGETFFPRASVRTLLSPGFYLHSASLVDLTVLNRFPRLMQPLAQPTRRPCAKHVAEELSTFLAPIGVLRG